MRRSGETEAAWLAAMPGVFVLIWSTGFVVARYGMPHAPPLGFLVLRYLCSVLAFGLWIAWARAAWPQGVRAWAHLGVSGLLMHAGYLGGVWMAVKAGIGAGSVALIVGLQPVLTALWLSSRSGGQAVAARQWLGLLLGLVGLAMVVAPKFGIGEITPWNFALSALALLSITAGTLYQKRYVAPCDVRSGNTVQLLAALVVTAPLAWLEAGTWTPHPELFGALAWSVLVLTLGGSSLFYLLLQRGAATRVVSLMYLVPPCTAVLAWALFGEPLSALVVAGIAVTALGVAVVVRA